MNGRFRSSAISRQTAGMGRFRRFGPRAALAWLEAAADVTPALPRLQNAATGGYKAD